MSRTRWTSAALMLLVVGAATAASIAQQPQTTPPRAQAARDPIDFERARQLLRREQAGEKLTADEQEYLDRAKAARAKGGARAPAAKGKASRGVSRTAGSPPRATTGLVPLTEMAADARYQGQDGGLYGNGRNTPPDEHLKLAMAAAGEIEPLDAAGRPSRDGKIGLLSIGMSNTTQEFSAFMRLAGAGSGRSPQVVLVDGAQGGQAAAQWADPEKNLQPGRANPWTVLDERLSRAGVSNEQVQVVWLKQADIAPAQYGEFPKHTDVFKKNCVAILQKLKERFPNLRLAYLSSRIYAGWAGTNLNPEPYAYEGAFAVRSIIQDQIAGKPDLNADAAKGPVKAPVVLWGPYLWGDGEKPRAADGLTWMRDDLAGDGTHPSESGKRKVAELLLAFFKSDATAKPWFTGAK